jgi:hypothetical protein
MLSLFLAIFDGFSLNSIFLDGFSHSKQFLLHPRCCRSGRRRALRATISRLQCPLGYLGLEGKNGDESKPFKTY